MPLLPPDHTLPLDGPAYAQGHEPGCPTCGLQQRDPAMAGKSYYRFRDVGSPLAVTASFAPGHSFGCAFVQKGSTRSDGVDTMWAFGVGPNTTQISAFSSTDLATWTQGVGLQLGGFGHTANDFHAFNNNVHSGPGKSFIMAIELGSPRDITGTPFTSSFAKHAGGDDLGSGWVFQVSGTYNVAWLAPPPPPFCSLASSRTRTLTSTRRSSRRTATKEPARPSGTSRRTATTTS